MKCFRTILRYMTPMGWALGRICLSIIGPTRQFSTYQGSWLSNCTRNATFQIPSQHRKYLYYGVLNCNERHQLLMKRFNIFIRQMKTDVLVGFTELCSTKVDSQITNKMQVWGILSVWKIGRWTVRRDIHSIWIILKPALDTDRRWEQLLTVSASHLWVSPCNFPPQLTLINCTQNARFSIPSQYRTGNTYCATRRGIHCSWSVPKPSLDALRWWYLWASLCIFLPLMGLIQTFSTNVDSQNADINWLWGVSKPSLDS